MIKTCFVRSDLGIYFLQVPDDSIWVFALIADDGLAFHGGTGAAREWEAVMAADVPPRIRQAFAWLTAEYPVT